MATLDKVTKVYSGKPGCMCGCNGKWTYSSTAKADSGCEPTRNDSIVKRTFNKIMKDPDVVVDDLGSELCYSVTTKTRLNVFYVQK
jgi:hypothetical protein